MTAPTTTARIAAAQAVVDAAQAELTAVIADNKERGNTDYAKSRKWCDALAATATARRLLAAAQKAGA